MALDSGQLVNLFIIAQDYKTTNPFSAVVPVTFQCLLKPVNYFK